MEVETLFYLCNVCTFIIIITQIVPYIPGLRIRIHFIRIRIRIQLQHFMLNTDPDPDWIRIQGFKDQKLEKNYS